MPIGVHLQNIVVLLLACGLSVGFFYWTGSFHSFWWMGLLYFVISGIETGAEHRDAD